MQEFTVENILYENGKKPSVITCAGGAKISGYDPELLKLVVGSVFKCDTIIKGDYVNIVKESVEIISTPTAEQQKEKTTDGTDWERKDDLSHRRTVLDTLIQTGCYNRKDGNIDRESLKADFDWAMGQVYDVLAKAPSTVPTPEAPPTTHYGWFVKLTADIGWSDDERANFIHGLFPKLSWKELTEIQKEAVVKAVRKEVELHDIDPEEIPF